VAVARVLSAKGLAGALKIESLTDWPEHLEPGARVLVEGEDQPRTIHATEPGGRVPVVSLEGITTREAAEGLVGRYLEVEPAPLPAGEYYWHQLEGLRVEDEEGAVLGVIREVFRAGGAEVYRVEQADGGELLLPGIHDVVREIDLDSGRMIVRYEVEEIG
jgi:16S rRNA processing protein RimM